MTGRTRFLPPQKTTRTEAAEAFRLSTGRLLLGYSEDTTPLPPRGFEAARLFVLLGGRNLPRAFDWYLIRDGRGTLGEARREAALLWENLRTRGGNWFVFLLGAAGPALGLEPLESGRWWAGLTLIHGVALPGLGRENKWWEKAGNREKAIKYLRGLLP